MSARTSTERNGQVDKKCLQCRKRKPKTRGLCGRCYLRRSRQVLKGKTTWQALEAENLVATPPMPFQDQPNGSAGQNDNKKPRWSEVLERLGTYPRPLTEWNEYDPFIQEGLKPERVFGSTSGSPRAGSDTTATYHRWRLEYDPAKIKLHEEKSAEVSKGYFVSRKDVESDGKIPAGTKFISPQKTLEKFQEKIPDANPDSLRAELRLCMQRGTIYLDGKKPRGYRFEFTGRRPRGSGPAGGHEDDRAPDESLECDPRSIWWVEADIDKMIEALSKTLSKLPKNKPGKKAKGQRLIPRASAAFAGIFPASNSEPERMTVPAIVEELNRRLAPYDLKITRSRVYRWLNGSRQLPEFVRTEFPDGIRPKLKKVPGSQDDFDPTMTKEQVDNLADAIVLIVKSARKRKLKTAREICILREVKNSEKRREVKRWLDKTFPDPKDYVWVERQKGDVNFLKCRGYNLKEIKQKLAGRSIVEAAKEQLVEDDGELVLAAMDGWDTTVRITSRANGRNGNGQESPGLTSARTSSVLEALCEAGRVARDPPLSLPRRRGGNMKTVRWRKVAAAAIGRNGNGQAAPPTVPVPPSAATPTIAPPAPPEPAEQVLRRTPAVAAPVVLGARDEFVFVLGKKKPPLKRATYDAVKALLEAGDAGLSGQELDDRSGHTLSSRGLKKLARRDEDWKRVLVFPGKPWGRYYTQTQWPT